MIGMAHLEHASMACANAAVACDMAKSALRYAFAAAMSCMISPARGSVATQRLTSSKQFMLCLRSLRVISMCAAGRLTLDPVVVVEN
jgi:hypothetical protein